MKRNPQIASSTLAAYIELTKPRITYLILVSTALGYFLGAGGIDDIWKFLMCLLGSSFVSAGSGALNHYMEINSDALMENKNLIKQRRKSAMANREKILANKLLIKF